MITIEQKTAERREIPLRIWVSLKGLEPRVDFILNQDGCRELVLAIHRGSLLTIAKVDGAENINHNERILVDYALHQMNPVRVTTYYERSYDPVTKATYDYYNKILADAEV